MVVLGIQWKTSKVLKLRIITGVLLAPIVLAINFLAPVWLFTLFISLIYLTAAWEWSHLIGIQKRLARLAYLLMMALLLIPAAAVSDTLAMSMIRAFQSGYIEQIIVVLRYNLLPLILHGSVMWWIFSLALIVSYPTGRGYWSSRLRLILISILVLLPFWVAVITTRLCAKGDWLLLYGLMLVWATDIGAYFAGKRFGKTKLAPQVSPGKTWEGVLGGASCALLIGLAFPYGLGFMLSGIQPQQDIILKLFILMAICVVFSVVGDLFESMIKRNCGVKDSGSILPGHGGLLDRIDGLTAALPVYATAIMLMSN